MRTTLVSVLTAALLAGTVGIAQADQNAARGSAATKIVLDDLDQRDNNRWRFFGHVESSKNKCLPDRTVKMFKKKRGEWVFADKDKTNAMGEWTTADRLPTEPPLKFTVKKEAVGGVTCGSDSIKPFSGPPMPRG